MSTLMPTEQPTSLTSEPVRTATMGPADELLDPQRRELIVQLLHAIGETKLNSIEWACLWFADLVSIRRMMKQCEQDEFSCSTVGLSLKNKSCTDMIKAWAVRSKNPRDTAQFHYDLEECFHDTAETGIEETSTKKRRRTAASGKPSKTLRRIAREEAGRPLATTSSATTRPETGSTSLSPKKWTGREAAAKKLCNERDNSTCVLTGFLEPLEVAHIYPYSIGQKGENELQDFWRVLTFFWIPEKVRSWSEHVLGPDGTETCSNMMCMVNVAHKLWEKARFALKPLSLSEDQRVLTVQFFWLPTNLYFRGIPAIETPSPFPRDFSSSTVNGEHSAKLYNIATDTKLCSGDIITFETDNPVSHPLPSVELLEMQWVLHRVLALSGAADATDEDLDPDSEMYFGLTSVGLHDEDTEWDTEQEVEEEGGG
ncbi:hypothetical protein BDV37DRAFT_287513 [Aspergillus pseudonomiae]|uniref:HNH nuclease domain-containing protein n=1 Tax=Aspergillus pseudonomiae TaxID=1506151 RepID=A0A5N7CZA5_9EURO|nr:uncharacterized protein BDV37DRAFT_287513 [Aspergillus pseudonomiae]KAE8399494.1 hypothetical protein BDV37DRAFT_287513 [Aspergillus pseudonomiae]